MSKTTIKKAIESAEHPILLESVTQLEQAAKTWQQSKVLGIDTEFVRERTYRAALGLVQVSDGKTAWLYDPLAISAHDTLSHTLTNPAIMKLLHSGSEDLEVLLNSMGVIPDPLVDTQMACAMLGQPLQLGYHHAVKWLFDLEIDKDQTRSNWCKRPLTSNQMRYAAIDVVLLPEMLALLQSKLEAAGRWSWLQEDVARAQHNARQSIDPETVYQRFAGIGRMDQGTLQILKYLARWREEIAIDRDRARGFVIPDISILQMARTKPASKEELAEIEGIHPVALSRYQGTLLQLIRQAGQDATPVATFDQLNEKQRAQLKKMRAFVEKKASDLAVEPALLASRKELERLIRAIASDQPIPERFLGWRKQQVTDELINILGQ